MNLYNYHNEKLKSWLERIVKLDKDDTGRFIDMNRLTFENYFHPLMKGKTSIKYTLPAVLSSCKSERIINWLENFEPGLSLLKMNNNGNIENPYNSLPPIEIFEQAENLKDGTGAMRVYDDLMFGLRKGNTIALKLYASALSRYCKLDTFAMVIIWEYWKSLTNSKMNYNQTYK
jgi:hypothetical protein